MFDFARGYAIETTEGSKIVECYLLSAVFDAPATSLFLNMIQFNGNYGCSYCLEKGENMKQVKRDILMFTRLILSPGQAFLI